MMRSQRSPFLLIAWRERFPDLSTMIIQAQGLVYSDLRGCAVGYLARMFVECDSFQWRIVVVVDGLNDVVGPAENGKGASGDVYLCRYRD